MCSIIGKKPRLKIPLKNPFAPPHARARGSSDTVKFFRKPIVTRMRVLKRVKAKPARTRSILLSAFNATAQPAAPENNAKRNAATSIRAAIRRSKDSTSELIIPTRGETIIVTRLENIPTRMITEKGSQSEFQLI